MYKRAVLRGTKITIALVILVVFFDRAWEKESQSWSGHFRDTVGAHSCGSGCATFWYDLDLETELRLSFLKSTGYLREDIRFFSRNETKELLEDARWKEVIIYHREDSGEETVVRGQLVVRAGLFFVGPVVLRPDHISRIIVFNESSSGLAGK